MPPSVSPPSFHPMSALANPKAAPLGTGTEAPHAAAPVKRSESINPEIYQGCSFEVLFQLFFVYAYHFSQYEVARNL